jgi:hypothetical protein
VYGVWASDYDSQKAGRKECEGNFAEGLKKPKKVLDFAG